MPNSETRQTRLESGLLELNFRGQSPLRTLLRLFDVSPGYIAVTVFFFVIKAAPVWLIPIVTRNIINAVSEPGEHPVSYIYLNAAILAAVLLQNVPSHIVFIRLLSKAIRKMELRVRSALVRRIQMLSLSFHDDFASGRLHSKMIRDVESLENLANQLMNNVLHGILLTAITLFVTLRNEPVVVLFYLITIPISIGLVRIFQKRIKNTATEFRTEIEQMSAHMADMIEMIPVTRAHGVENVEIGRMDSRLNKVMSRGFNLDFVNALFGSMTWVSFGIFQLVCLVFTSLLAYEGKIKVGDVVMYQSFFGMIIGSVSMMLNVYPQLIKGFESIRSIGEILESPDIEQNDGRTVIDSLAGRFEFENVGFSYPGTAHHAVKDFSLKVEAGECIAVVGESGSGKSTLMNLIIGFRRPDSGRILVDGLDMQALDLRSYRSFLAVVPQHTILFSGSIRDNITYGLDTYNEEQLHEAMRLANAVDFIQALPNGLESRIGEHGGKLSGGQRQRIAIARALIRNPRIIILDEATSALDVHSERQVQEAVDHLIKDRTTFIVAHRLSTIRNANRIVVMSQGRIVEVGTPTELLSRQGEFARLKTLQA